MTMTIHKVKMIETGNIDRKTGTMIMNSKSILEYTKYRKRVDYTNTYRTIL